MKTDVCICRYFFLKQCLGTRLRILACYSLCFNNGGYYRRRVVTPSARLSGTLSYSRGRRRRRSLVKSSFVKYDLLIHSMCIYSERRCGSDSLALLSMFYYRLCSPVLFDVLFIMFSKLNVQYKDSRRLQCRLSIKR